MSPITPEPELDGDTPLCVVYKMSTVFLFDVFPVFRPEEGTELTAVYKTSSALSAACGTDIESPLRMGLFSYPSASRRPYFFFSSSSRNVVACF